MREAGVCEKGFAKRVGLDLGCGGHAVGGERGFHI